MDIDSAPKLSADEVNARHHVYRIMDKHLSAAFEELDHLHKRGIHDNAVIKALRDGGYRSEADAYIEWAACIDPDAEDDNTTMSPVVPDPGDAPSYDTFNPHQKIMADIEANSPDFKGFQQAGEARPRIDSGLFYALQSVDGVHWHIYKRRNSDDNGAFLATADSKEAAETILNSLGTGRPSTESM